MQIYLQFSEREESSTQFKDTNKRAKMQIYLQFSERKCSKISPHSLELSENFRIFAMYKC
jgi:hypothetical protein